MKINTNKIISADHKIIRQINRSNVLNIIREKASISRVEISKLSGLNKSTISNIVNELIHEGLVFEESVGQSSIGRKPIILRLNERSRILGLMNVKTLTTTLAVCDLGRKVLDIKEVETTVGNAEKFFSSCAEILAKMIKPFKEPLAGVGVSSPGMINSAEGFLYTHMTVKWTDVDIREIIGKKLNCKVFVENDAKAGALAELWFAEEGRDLENFVFVWVCDGIGVGIVMNGSLYHGYRSTDGHFGHQLIKIDGRWEDVSGEHTWEDNASDLGVVKRYSEYSGAIHGKDTENEMQKVVELALKGDHNAIRALQETARYLGVGIANINIGLGPERFIVGGKIVQVWDVVFPELVRQVELQTIYQVVPVRELIIPSSLPSAPFDGAQAAVIKDVFEGYQIR